jgi:3-hydroxyacyl-CoA dehydrogenase
MVNRVSQDWLVRPMGIFQLIDYVGVDVFQCILGVMDRFIDGEELQSDLIDRMIASGAVGGQRSDGSQKEGFFRYEKGRITAVYCLDRGEYRALDPSWTDPLDRALGALPPSHAPWKVLSRAPDRAARLTAYFADLAQTDTLGARLAIDHLKRSKQIGEQLVASGVAQSVDDVNGVLLYGFYHLYGPINDYI